MEHLFTTLIFAIFGFIAGLLFLGLIVILYRKKIFKEKSNPVKTKEQQPKYHTNHFFRIFDSLPIATVIFNKELDLVNYNKTFVETIGIDPEIKKGSINLKNNPLYSNEEINDIKNGTYKPCEKQYDLNLLNTSGYMKCSRKETVPLWTVFEPIRNNENDEIEYHIMMLIDNSKINILLNDILDNLPIPIMVKDIDNDFRYMYWNKESELQSKIKKADAIGHNDFEIYDQERAASYRAIDLKLTEAGKKYSSEEIYILPSGEKRTSIVVKSIIQNYKSRSWLLLARWDITDRRKSEDQLRIAKEEAEKAIQINKLVFNNINIGLVYIDTQFIVQWESTVNMGVLSNIKRYIPGKKCCISMFGRTEPCKTCALTEMFQSKQITNHTISVTGREIDIIASPVYNNDGELIGGILRMEDITEKKQIEVELEAAKESNKLKSAFLANMSHEIRTPLNAIVGFSNILANTDNPDERKEYAGIISTNNEILLQLISDILDLSKIEAETLEFVYSDVDINSLLNTLIQQAKVRNGASSLVIQISETQPECIIQTEKNRLSQVINNFINNALKFTKEGSISIGYRLVNNNSSVYFYVTDTGCGIEKNKLHTIFDRFVKLDNFTQGTGLGLPICQMIIERLGGEIGVESVVGKGSTFWFTIPYVKVALPVSEKNIPQQEFLPQTIQKEQFKILIAEDNPSNFKLFVSMLGKNYQLIHAWNGTEAVEMFKEQNPHLILMDIRMPVMDGYEATKKIRELSATIPIIATTAYAFSSDEQLVLESGFNGYISKPIHKTALHEKIQALLSNRFIVE